MDAADRSSLPRRPSQPNPREPLPRSLDSLPPLDAAFDEILDQGVDALGIELSARQRAALAAHVRLLLAWNAHVNLSGLRSVEQIARGHVLDALLALPALQGLVMKVPGARPPTLLDLGSGGGFPGLPLAITLPARRGARVDSVAKKAAFLEAAAAVVSGELAGAADAPQAIPEIVVLNERAEDLADEAEHRESWDLIVARAVGSVAEVAELGLPLARRGGQVVVWKRDTGDGELQAELARAERLIRAAGGARPSRITLEAAGQVGLAGNCLVAIRKLRPTAGRYPRPPGERRRSALP